MIIETGSTGTPLKDIINNLGNKKYDYIEFRCKWIENNEEQDEFFGACSYDNITNTLIPLDGDSYSLYDLYEEYEEWQDTNNRNCLTVWEYGIIGEE